jgi:hypothetical protein
MVGLKQDPGQSCCRKMPSPADRYFVDRFGPVLGGQTIK